MSTLTLNLFGTPAVERPLHVHRPCVLSHEEKHRPRPWRLRPALATAVASARVLVAEDDPAMREMIVEALRETGYSVIEAANGTQLASCLADIKGRTCPRPDLVISDVRMPGKSGLDVLAALRKWDWVTPVILITSFGDAKTHEEARALGAATILDKPFDMDDLVHLARSIVPPDVCR